MFTPTLDLISEQFPEAQIDFLLTQKGSAFPIRHRKDVSEIHFTSLKVQELLKSVILLRKNKYDYSIVTSGGKPWKVTLLSKLIGATNKIGEYHNYRKTFYDKSVKYQLHKHRVLNNIDIVKLLIPVPDDRALRPSYTLKDSHDRFADSFVRQHNLQSKIIMGVHPGSNAEFAFRRWAKESFAEVINTLSIHFESLAFLVFVGPDEQHEGEYLEKECDVISVREKDLDNVAALISKCNFFFNSDSGLGHIAYCFPTPYLFTIFGPADEHKTGPYTKRCTVIKKGLQCQSCNPENKKMKLQCQLECLSTLTAQEVLNVMVPEIGLQVKNLGRNAI